MNACVALSPQSSRAVIPLQMPIVLVRGVPEFRISIMQFHVMGPADRRTATLAVQPEAITAEPELTDRLIGAEASIIHSDRLVDGSMRRQVLTYGTLEALERNVQARNLEAQITLTDHWNQVIDRTFSDIWWQTSDGVLIRQPPPAALLPGGAGNASSETWMIGKQYVQVLQEQGLPWTVGAALQTVSAFSGLNLSIDLLPPDIANAPLTKSVDLGDAISASLADFLDTYGLIIQRAMKFESGRVTETRVVRTTTNTRRVELAWADGSHIHGQPLTLSSHGQSRQARPWIAEADGAIIESTFELVHGWDSALEGQSDATYSRDGNSNFVPYANVYRLWVLNEDGQFTGPPYNQGPAFDLATFFTTEPLRPQLLTWKDNLTLDDTGARLPPIVEISTDAGQTWTSYPGIVNLAFNRAAVYLDDATLPAGYLAAAKAGQAKLRITASLQHPARMRILRW